MFCYLRKSAEGWAVTVAVSFGWCIMLFNTNLIIINNIIFHILSNILIIVGTKRTEEKLKAPVCWETKWPTTKPNQLLYRIYVAQNYWAHKMDSHPFDVVWLPSFGEYVYVCVCFFFFGGWGCQFYFFPFWLEGCMNLNCTKFKNNNWCFFFLKNNIKYMLKYNIFRTF